MTCAMYRVLRTLTCDMPCKRYYVQCSVFSVNFSVGSIAPCAVCCPNFAVRWIASLCVGVRDGAATVALNHGELFPLWASTVHTTNTTNTTNYKLQTSRLIQQMLIFPANMGTVLLQSYSRHEQRELICGQYSMLLKGGL